MKQRWAEVDGGLVEAGGSHGIRGHGILVWRVYLKESIPAITRVTMITAINLIGLTAMAGAIGAGGLGDFCRPLWLSDEYYGPDVVNDHYYSYHDQHHSGDWKLDH